LVAEGAAVAKHRSTVVARSFERVAHLPRREKCAVAGNYSTRMTSGDSNTAEEPIFFRRDGEVMRDNENGYVFKKLLSPSVVLYVLSEKLQCFAEVIQWPLSVVIQNLWFYRPRNQAVFIKISIALSFTHKK